MKMSTMRFAVTAPGFAKPQPYIVSRHATLEAAQRAARKKDGFEIVALRYHCVGCLTNYADPPSDLCPGCEAYREHTA